MADAAYRGPRLRARPRNGKPRDEKAGQRSPGAGRGGERAGEQMSCRAPGFFGGRWKWTDVRFCRWLRNCEHATNRRIVYVTVRKLYLNETVLKKNLRVKFLENWGEGPPQAGLKRLPLGKMG